MFLIIFFFIYQLLQLVFLPIILFYFIVRFFKKKSLGCWKERCGFVPKTTKTQSVLWIHAVSVGEVNAIEHFINLCKHEQPNLICYLTTGTIGGRQVAKKLNADIVSFIPFDFLLPMFIAFARIRPTKLVIVEAEIWPNLLMLAHYKKIPLYLLNGRINQKSKNKRRLIGFLYRLFTHIFAQSERDAELFRAFGIKPQKIAVLGDIKAFNVVEKKQELLAQEPQPQLKSPYTIILAGSLHAQEVDVYLTTLLNLRKLAPNLRLILVPRHFHWQQELVTKLTANNISFTLWTEATTTPTSLSQLDTTITHVFATSEVLVVCKLGILFSLYPLATMYCLGGTFVPVGGHNLLEPSVWGKPSLIGPYDHRCAAVANQLYAAGGLIKTTSQQELQTHLLNLAQDPNIGSKMGALSLEWVTFQAEKIKQKLKKFIELP